MDSAQRTPLGLGSTRLTNGYMPLTLPTLIVQR